MPSYELVCHPTAKRELDALDSADKDRLTSELADVARERQPTGHASVRQLEGQNGLFRVRVGDLRAVLELDKPRLCVLRVGHRANVYDVIDDIDDRRASA